MIQRTEQEIMQNWKTDDKPLVSIACATYNHENYITEAIESFLMQETDFPFEVFVHDDCSTDNTATVIREYGKKYPNIIKSIYQKENQYSKGVRVTGKFIFPRAQGKYIAVCEGDDYWTDLLKLQKQVEFMESNSDYALCYTSATVINDQGVIINQNKNFGDSSQFDLIAGAGLAILGSVMFRRFDMQEYSEYRIINGDNLLWHYLGFYGKCKHLEDIKNSIYRVHAGGTWSGRSDTSKLVEAMKTYSLIRKRIITNVEDNALLLKKHDLYYPYMFASYFYGRILRLDPKGFTIGLKELKKASFIKKHTVFFAFLKHIVRSSSAVLKLKT